MQSSTPNSTPQYSRPIIKTKEAHIQQDALPYLEQPSQALDRGKKLFQQHQSQKAAEKRLKEQRINAEIPVPSIPQTGQDKQDKPFRPSLVQQSGQHRETSGLPIPRTKADIQNELASCGKTAVNTVRPNGVMRSPPKAAGQTAGQTVKTAENTSRQIIKSAGRRAETIERTVQAVPQARRRTVQAVCASKKAAITISRISGQQMDFTPRQEKE